jgi:hypothetical protein
MLRVIQWATGSVGRHAVAAVHEHPELELVGALVYSEAKAGRDVGDICEIGDIGVVATKSPDEDETDQGCLGTAMHAVHAIAPVCAAAPGIRTFLDLPMITGRGVLTSH